MGKDQLERIREQCVPPPVYCRDCRFLRQTSPRPGWYVDATLTQRRYEGLECRHPHAIQGSSDWYSAGEKRRTPTERNTHNDCLDFQPRTWWQRWRMFVGAAVVLGLFTVRQLCR